MSSDYTVKFHFTDTDDHEGTGVDLTANITEMSDVFEKSGEDKVKADLSIRASRLRDLKVKIKYVPLLIDSSDGQNDHSLYLLFQEYIQTYEYCFIISCDFIRLNSSGTSFWTEILPEKFELIEDSLGDPDHETGLQDYDQTWQMKEHYVFT